MCAIACVQLVSSLAVEQLHACSLQTPAIYFICISFKIVIHIYKKCMQYKTTSHLQATICLFDLTGHNFFHKDDL